jgi:hypothetical protein
MSNNNKIGYKIKTTLGMTPYGLTIKYIVATSNPPTLIAFKMRLRSGMLAKRHMPWYREKNKKQMTCTGITQAKLSHIVDI